MIAFLILAAILTLLFASQVSIEVKRMMLRDRSPLMVNCFDGGGQEVWIEPNTLFVYVLYALHEVHQVISGYTVVQLYNALCYNYSPAIG